MGKGRKFFSPLSPPSDPVPLMIVTGSDSAGVGRHPDGADLAEIESRSFYQPPEVDLTPLFLDSETR